MNRSHTPHSKRKEHFVTLSQCFQRAFLALRYLHLRLKLTFTTSRLRTPKQRFGCEFVRQVRPSFFTANDRIFTTLANKTKAHKKKIQPAYVDFALLLQYPYRIRLIPCSKAKAKPCDRPTISRKTCGKYTARNRHALSRHRCRKTRRTHTDECGNNELLRLLRCVTGKEKGNHTASGACATTKTFSSYRRPHVFS